MPTPTNPWTRNLEALSQSNPALAQRLAANSHDLAALQFAPTPQEVPTATLADQHLSSRHRPLEEADRIAQSFDPADKAVVAVLGFGLGYHVAAILNRLKSTGLVVVFEPDLALLRAVLNRIDSSAWLSRRDLIFIDDPDDRTELNARLEGHGALVAQGVAVIEHPASRGRLGAEAGRFAQTLTDCVRALRTTMSTTLVHAVTTCRNLCLNLDHYGAGDGIKPLRQCARGRAAILVAAGPSLARNIHLLEDPAVRERHVIIAAQTVLKPLLARGIKPHFVTALDYHEISGQFYEDIDERDLQDVTLVCEPKANRAILDGFPGGIRCVASPFLDELLGRHARPMGFIKPGATVAHLSFHLAQYLGCDPIIFIGQDLGFSEGLYYGPGAAIHEQWAPELNRFNTIEMMEWQRIARMKSHLRETTDQHGRTILIDEQMSTYLQHFETEFARAEQRIIDATEGGTAKRHSEIRRLQDVLDELREAPPLPSMPKASSRSELNHDRLADLSSHLAHVADEVERLRSLSQEADGLLENMLRDQQNAEQMDRYFDDLDRCRTRVDAMPHIMELVGALNQLGIFNRLRADRRLTLAEDLDAMTRQRRQMERDRVNVQWIADACEEFKQMLDEAGQTLRGESVSPRINERLAARSHVPAEAAHCESEARPVTRSRVAALLAADPQRNGLLVARSLDERFLGRSVLQCTLERLNSCTRFDDVILTVPEGFDVERLIDRSRLRKNVIIHRSQTPLYDAQHATIAAGRRWSETCWRGGIGGLTVFDEIICPKAMSAAMEAHGLDAAVVIGADWLFVDPSAETGCDALISRHLEAPDSYEFVFTRQPPGLSGCLVSISLMKILAERHRPGTIGARLTYIPTFPLRDPVTSDTCVRVPAHIRSHMGRVTFDSEQRRRQLRLAFDALGDAALSLTSSQVLKRLDDARLTPMHPQQVQIELCTNRLVDPDRAASLPGSRVSRSPMSTTLISRIAEQVAVHDNVAITLRGAGDPLLHPQFPTIVRTLRSAGMDAIHVHTDLLEPEDVIDDLLNLPIDVISVNLNADRQATYRATMGEDRFQDVVHHLERLINKRAARVGALSKLALPWIVPTITRSRDTVDDIRHFIDRWIHFVGAAVIEPAHGDLSLIPLPCPESVQQRDASRCMTILSDGAVTSDEQDLSGDSTVANIGTSTLEECWDAVVCARQDATTKRQNARASTTAGTWASSHLSARSA